MKALLDVNVLIALAWPSHLHHEIAHRWFREEHHFGWATCPVTQSAFVRISSNRKVLPEAKSPHEALLLLRRIVSLAHHEFLFDDLSLATSSLLAPEKILGFRQVTDAHLLALALRHEARLVTFDRGLRSLVPNDQDPKQVLLTLESP